MKYIDGQEDCTVTRVCHPYSFEMILHLFVITSRHYILIGDSGLCISEGATVDASWHDIISVHPHPGAPSQAPIIQRKMVIIWKLDC